MATQSISTSGSGPQQGNAHHGQPPDLLPIQTADSTNTSSKMPATAHDTVLNALSSHRKHKHGELIAANFNPVFSDVLTHSIKTDVAGIKTPASENIDVQHSLTDRVSMRSEATSGYVSMRSEATSGHVSTRSEATSGHVSLRSEAISGYVSTRSEAISGYVSTRSEAISKEDTPIPSQGSEVALARHNQSIDGKSVSAMVSLNANVHDALSSGLSTRYLASTSAEHSLKPSVAIAQTQPGKTQIASSMPVNVPTAVNMPVDAAMTGSSNSFNDRRTLLKASEPLAMIGLLAGSSTTSTTFATAVQTAHIPLSPSLNSVTQQIAVQSAVLQAGQLTELRLRLHPPELGDLMITIQKDHTGQLSTQLVATTSAGHDLLAANLAQLRDALAQQTGTGNVQVSVSQQQTSGHSKGGQAFMQQSSQQTPDRTHTVSAATASGARDSPRIPVQRLSNSLIDYIV